MAPQPEPAPKPNEEPFPGVKAVLLRPPGSGKGTQLCESTEQSSAQQLGSSAARRENQQSSSDNLQPGSDKKQEIKSVPSINSQLEQSSGLLESKAKGSDNRPKQDSIMVIRTLEESIRARKVSINNRKLLIAAGEGELEEVESFIKEGGNVNFVDRDGNTALHYAVQSSKLDVIKLLIEHNAKIDIENEQSETSFDFAIRLNNEEIIKEFGKKIIDRSVEILEGAKKTTSQGGKNIKSEVASKNIQTSSQAPQQNEDQRKIEEERAKTREKIKALLQLLDIKGSRSNYEKAMIFILFIETFAFQGSNSKDIRSELKKEFLGKEEETRTEEYRSLFLKSKTKSYALEDINRVIKTNFLNNLKQELSLFDRKNKKIEIEKLLEKLDSNIKSSVGSADNPDSYGKLIDLANKASEEGVDLYEQLFAFILNIYPKLGEEKKEKSSILGKEIKNLRNNLVHSFYNYGIYDFREAVIDLRQKFFQYAYARQVSNNILNSLIDKDLAEIKKGLEEQLREIEKKFVPFQTLSSEKADQLFGYRVVKCLYSPLVKEPSQQEEQEEALLSGLVIDYWRYLLPVDIGSAQGFSNNEFGDENDFKELDSVSRRELFEKFIALKRTKKIFPDYYVQTKEELKKKVEEYGCSTSSFDQICKNYIENNQNFDEKTNEVIDKIVRFISTIKSVKEILGYREKNIVSLARDILEVQNENVKKLVLTKLQSINKVKKELEEKAGGSQKITQLIDLMKDLRGASIEVDTVDKKVDVTKTVINIFETLYNAYNEYKVDFDLKDIFATRSFLNELIEEIKDIPIVIERLIDIGYMSPLVSSLIVKESRKVTNSTNLEKLIDRMLDGKEYANYLTDLLKVECYDEFKFYEKFYRKVCEKDIDIQSVSPIFKEPRNIEGFIGVLINKFEESSDDGQEKNKIIQLAKSLLEIINKEIAEEYYYKNTGIKLSEVLQAAEKVNTLKDKIGEAYPDFSGFADMSILEAKIKNQEKKSQEALTILENLEKELENNASLKASYLLTLGDIAYYTYKSQEKYEEAQKKYTVLYNEIIKYSLKLKPDTEASKVDCTLYKKVKDLNEYKNLLHHSELLHSEKYLHVLNVLAGIAHMTLQSGKKNNDVDSLKEALEIYQKVYRFCKEELGSDHKKVMQVLGYVASVNMKIGDIYKRGKRYPDALSYYQSALIRYNTVYDLRKKMLGNDHGLVLKTAINIIINLNSIAYTNNGLALLKSSNNLVEALEHRQEALKIYENVYEFQKSSLGEEHEYTLNTMLCIAYTNNGLALLKSSNNPVEALQHYEEAEKTYRKVYNIQVSIFGEGDRRTKSTKKQIDRTIKWKENLVQTHPQLTLSTLPFYSERCLP